jgi:diketogulonate reductase-like aldo/keto reductase
MGYGEAKQALQRSLKRMQIDYVDLYLIHWPRMTASPEENWKERDLETWRAMEDMKKEGLVKSIGVSNFLPHHLENLIQNSSTVPAVDQLEMHAGYYQEYTLQYLKEHNILPMAWSPFGRGEKQAAAGNEIIMKLAEKYGKSAQLINLRFLLQKGILPIPKASSEAHIRANLEAFDFEMSEEDLSMLSCMPQTTWLGEHPDFAIPTAKSSPDRD